MTRLLLWSTAAILTFAHGTAGATVTKTVGGPGGSAFTLTCPKNSVAVGVRARTGAWVDGLTLLCSGSARGTRQETGWVGSTHSSPQEAYCSRGGAMRGLSVGFTRKGLDPEYIDSIEMECVEGSQAPCIETGDYCGTRQVRGNDAMFAEHLWCPEDEVMVGLVGRAGKSVDALGAVCGPAPGLIRAGGPNSTQRPADRTWENIGQQSVRPGSVSAIPGRVLPNSTAPATDSPVSVPPGPDSTIDGADRQLQVPIPPEPPR